jgi:UDPglucose 6-dehydrogenase
MPIYEPGLDQLRHDQRQGRPVGLNGYLAAALHEAKAVFIAVGIPARHGDGHVELSYVSAAAELMARALIGYAVILAKSTAPSAPAGASPRSFAQHAPTWTSTSPPTPSFCASVTRSATSCAPTAWRSASSLSTRGRCCAGRIARSI